MVVKGAASFRATTSVLRRNISALRHVDLLTEVVCNLLVQHYLLAVTQLRYTERPRVFYRKLLDEASCVEVNPPAASLHPEGFLNLQRNEFTQHSHHSVILNRTRVQKQQTNK